MNFTFETPFQAVDYRLGSVITSLVTTACGISIAFAYSWQLASLIVALVPFAGFAHYLHIRFMEGRHRKSSKEVETSGKVIFLFFETFGFLDETINSCSENVDGYFATIGCSLGY